jgi:hypothetical protein
MGKSITGEFPFPFRRLQNPFDFGLGITVAEKFEKDRTFSKVFYLRIFKAHFNKHYSIF